MRIWGGPCPNCRSENTEINYLEYQLPDIGKVLIVSFACKDCLLRYSDIYPESIDLKDYEIVIEKEEDLKGKRIYKIPDYEIVLKEVEIEIRQISGGKFLVYTVEGFLLEIIDFLKSILKSFPEKSYIINQKIKYLEDVLNGKKKLTIIIKKVTS